MSKNAPKVLGLDALRKRLNTRSIILWPNGQEVESGNVVFLAQDQLDVCWLEGFKSRNDSVRYEEVLAVHDGRGPEMTLGDFVGKGYLTEAGLRWKQA